MNESINVIQFVDDTIFFFNNSEGLSSRVQRCLTIFFMILGLNINLSKSTVIQVGQNHDSVVQVFDDLGCRVGFFPISYLGLPLGWQNPDYGERDHVVDLVRPKLSL